MYLIRRIFPSRLRWFRNPSHCNGRHGFDPCRSIPPCHGSMDRCSSSLVVVSNRTSGDHAAKTIKTFTAISYSSNADIYFARHSDRRSIQTQEEFRSDCFEKWTLASVSYEDCFLLEWCYKKCLWQAMGWPDISGIRMYKVVLKTGFSMIFPWVFSMNDLGDALSCQVGWPLAPAFVEYCGISQMPTLGLQFGGKIYTPLKRARF